MNHQRIARTYLAWFAQDAEIHATEGGVHYIPGTDTVTRYTHKSTGCIVNAYLYCSRLATERLPHDDAAKVQAALRDILV